MDETKYLRVERLAIKCRECGSYADTPVMIKHYATCCMAEAPRLAALEAIAEEMAQAILMIDDANFTHQKAAIEKWLAYKASTVTTDPT